MPAGRSSFPAPDREFTDPERGWLTFEVPALAGAASIVGDADAFGPNLGGISAVPGGQGARLVTP